MWVLYKDHQASSLYEDQSRDLCEYLDWVHALIQSSESENRFTILREVSAVVRLRHLNGGSVQSRMQSVRTPEKERKLYPRASSG